MSNITLLLARKVLSHRVSQSVPCAKVIHVGRLSYSATRGIRARVRNVKILPGEGVDSLEKDTRYRIKRYNSR